MNSNQNKLQLFEVPQIESIQDMFLKSADKFSNKLAMEDLTNYPISKVTYSKLNEYIIKFGSSLQKLGIKPRDHIAVIERIGTVGNCFSCRYDVRFCNCSC